MILKPWGFTYGNGEKNVYVIPIKGEINPAVTQFVKKSIGDAQEDPGATAIIFEIDTLGGRIDQATEIRDEIMKTPLTTISFVNNRAESAGVLITISSQYIVMGHGSTIGSAETIPYTEKNISYWKGELRSTAEQRGRDPKLVEAMADKRIELEDPNQEGKYIVKKDELLNLTTNEAEKLGFTDYVGDNVSEIMSFLHMEDAKVIHVNQDFKVLLAQWVSSTIILPIILSVGFLGLIIEIFSPGFGIGGTISLIAFTLFFWGSVMAGNAGVAVIAIFITGILLLVIEAIMPGFGAPGIGGILCILASIILSSDSVTLGITSLAIAFVISVMAAIVLIKYGPKNKYFDKIILGTQLGKDKGFIATYPNDDLVGLEGIATTTLRPAGTVQLADKKIDVVTEGEFIEKDSRVIVIKTEGRRIVVKKIN